MDATQLFEQFGRHALGQTDHGVTIVDVDLADVTPLDADLIGDRTYDLAR